jgi:hypothetical protein
VILEDEHGNYIDRAAYRAAYDALVANGSVKLAQVRDDVAKKIVVELMRHRADQGAGALGEYETRRAGACRGPRAAQRRIHVGHRRRPGGRCDGGRCRAGGGG